MAKYQPNRPNSPHDKPKYSHREDEINSIPGTVGTEIEPFANVRKNVSKLINRGNTEETRSLQMYTEDQVSRLLQVSLSQLRKWRMQPRAARSEGPPFKKIGRLVRYPEEALRDFVNGNSSSDHEPKKEGEHSVEPARIPRS